MINLLGGGAAADVTLITPHILIGTSDTQEISFNWDKKTGVSVPCRRGAEVSRHVRRRIFAALFYGAFRSGGKI